MTGVIVLGTHRTGTSAIAGVLHKLGVNMGDDMYMEHPSNPAGHYEDKAFLYLNDEAIGNWRNPRLEMPEGYLNRYIKIIHHKHTSYNLWGAKDPRFCITLRWIYLYIDNLTIISTHRDLKESARSLQAVHGMSLERAEEIQKIYLNQKTRTLNEIISRYKHLNVANVDFDDLFKRPDKIIRSIIRVLGITDDNYEAALRHINPELRHFNETQG